MFYQFIFLKCTLVWAKVTSARNILGKSVTSYVCNVATAVFVSTSIMVT